MKKNNLLIINPGSTSTKIAVFEDEQSIFEKSINHSGEMLNGFETMIDQFDFRKEVILKELNQNGIALETIDAVVGRGGLLKPMKGGTYTVSEEMLRDLKSGSRGEHASNLGGILAHEIAAPLGIPSFIVDPVVVDEMDDVARVSGMADVPRKSIFHALNQKSVARKAAAELDKQYGNSNLIVAHMGGGISVGAHRKGSIVDVNNALDGDGPFSPERSGAIPIGDLARICYSGSVSHEELKKKIKGNGGLQSYLGTNDGRVVKKMIDSGDEMALLVYQAMAYQVAKEIGSCATVLKGEVDAVIITGGLAYDELFTSWIIERVEFIAPILIYPGEAEMTALAEGGLRVLRKEEDAREYR